MKKYFAFTPLFICIILSCDKFVSNKICKENNVERFCTQKEVEVIDGINYIVDRILSFDPKDLTKEFLFDEVKGREASLVHFLGENHLDFEGQLLNLGYINYFARQGGMVLFEGESRKKEIKRNPLATLLQHLLELYTLREMLQQGFISDVVERANWINKNMPVDEAVNSFQNYKDKLLLLDLSNIKYGHWDVPREKVEIKTDVKRNSSMVKTIFSILPTIPSKPLFIIAGARHLPLGDLYLSRRINQENNIPNNYDVYYKLVEQAKEHLSEKRSLILRENAGSTEIIYKRLKAEGIGFFQAIPISSFIY